MNTAILIGRGPEVDALIERADRLPPNLILLDTNLSGVATGVRYPKVDLFDPARVLRTLRRRKATRVTAVGVLRPTGPFLKEAKQYAELKRLSLEILKAPDANEATRKYIHSLLKSDFKFPVVKSVLPFLFARRNVSINPNTALLEEILKQHGRSGKCSTVTLDGEAARIFRVPAWEGGNLSTCCLLAKELEKLHQQKSIKRFFFDRNRTIVIEYRRIAAYARKHQLTLQSFV
jgi:hypothetical protein